ncbi:hypothetical protein B9Z55_015468 [Caenorhabditis nigoni]|uniref:Uncharacterized protein n=2 Tax=Caenorhabditis nigoni TaxID=1611254 RepID=A0A2G5UAX5_9PELO|nr:hypothetical protein B9Z55_015468 [Caenorhabditis nigoni]
MISLFIIFILIFQFSPSFSNSDDSVENQQLQSQFHFTGYFTCKWTEESVVQDFWLMEWDTITPDDKIHQVVELFRDNYPYSYELYAEENGDGLWDNYYELYYKNTHNCTVSRKTVTQNFMLPEYSVHVSRIEEEIIVHLPIQY